MPRSRVAASLGVVLLLTLHVAVTDGFAPMINVGGRRVNSGVIGSRPARAGVGRSAGAATMQMPKWVEIAASQQGRDPARLAPLKELDPAIVVRMSEKKDFESGETPYADGLLGIGQRVNPGDWSPDMMRVCDLARNIGGYDDKDIFQMMMLGQGWRSYIVAEDTRTGEIVGCAQLTRIQVGGYLYLTDDLQVQHIFVKEEYRRLGIANHMVNTLLDRVKPTQRVWGFADKETPAFFALFASGFVGITYTECGRVFPAVLWALLWPFHRVGLSKPDNVFFATEGRGDMSAYNPAG